MKKSILVLALSLFWFNLIYAQQKSDRKLAAEFDKVLAEQFKPNEPGVTALVSRNGKVIYKKAFGMANLELNTAIKVDNIFRIGSLTKQFTAVAILQLMEQGKLDLQDEITKFIPDYPMQGAKITIEHLLTHTSGIQNYTAMKDYQERMALDLKPSEMIDHFKDQPLRFAPGTKWEYSNSNYFLLGYIIEKISRKPYSEYIEKNLLKPAGMTRSLYASNEKLVKNKVEGYSKNEKSFEIAPAISMTQPYAAGSILSTIEDFFKWNQAVLANKLVKKESLAKAFTNYKLADGKESNYGYGWRFGNIYDSPSIWHGGGINGFGTMGLYLPKEDVFVAVFANCDCYTPKEIASRMAAIATGKIHEYKEITVKNIALPEYRGVYENTKGQQRIITVSDNKLYSQVGRGPKSDLKPYQKDLFFFNEMQTIDFARNEKGEIEKLTTKNLNGSDVWQKTNKPIPSENGIKLDGKTLEAYVGAYEVSPQFIFSISKEQDKLFLQAPQQEKIEMFPETAAKFFLKVNDAEFVFVKDDAGQVTKAIMNQGGRQADAKKIK
jgi:CubicO group peptidase (beta-lactamase class C family)